MSFRFNKASILPCRAANIVLPEPDSLTVSLLGLMMVLVMVVGLCVCVCSNIRVQGLGLVTTDLEQNTYLQLTCDLLVCSGFIPFRYAGELWIGLRRDPNYYYAFKWLGTAQYPSVSV